MTEGCPGLQPPQGLWRPACCGVSPPCPAALTDGRVSDNLFQEGLAGGGLLGQHDLLLGQLPVQLVQLNGGLLQFVQPALQPLALS